MMWSILDKLLAGATQAIIMNYFIKISGEFFFCHFAAPEEAAQLAEHIARHHARLGT